MGRIRLCAALAIGLTAALPAWATDATNQPSFDQLRSEAVAALNKAADVRGEWRDSRDILKDAEQAAAAGDLTKAMELATIAKRQGELGYAQAMEQRKAAQSTDIR